MLLSHFLEFFIFEVVRIADMRTGKRKNLKGAGRALCDTDKYFYSFYGPGANGTFAIDS